MWDRFVNYHGLNNLIWVWTTQGYDSEWYPGDQYVDMIARDIYSKTEGSSFGKYFVYDKGQHPNKMLALAECGRNNKNLATINEQWEAGAKWSYFMPWYDGKRTANATPNSINPTSRGGERHGPRSTCCRVKICLRSNEYAPPRDTTAMPVCGDNPVRRMPPQRAYHRHPRTTDGGADPHGSVGWCAVRPA